MSGSEIDELIEQERELVLDSFTDTDAWELGTWMVETARERGYPIAIDIVRHGHRLFHFSFDGASPDNEHWIRRKAALVDRTGHSSYYIGRVLAAKGQTIEEAKLIPQSRFAPHGGAFPLLIRGVGPVGHVAVSGLPQKDDHDFVVEALRHLLAAKAR